MSRFAGSPGLAASAPVRTHTVPRITSEPFMKSDNFWSDPLPIGMSDVDRPLPDPVHGRTMAAAVPDQRLPAVNSHGAVVNPQLSPPDTEYRADAAEVGAKYASVSAPVAHGADAPDAADLFRAALGSSWTVTERGALIDVAHNGRLAVRIAAAEVTPEIVAHHQRWLSAVSL